METFHRSPVTIFLMGVNIVAFLITDVLGGIGTENVLMKAGVMIVPDMIAKKEYYRLLTSIFLHYGMAHLGNNMLLLFVLGGYLERTMGAGRYLLLYLTGGIGANILSCLWDVRSGLWVESAGASGAVFAVMGGLCYVAVVDKGQLQGLTAKKMTLMAVLALYVGYTSQGVDNAAHVGGLVLGFCLAVLLYRKKPIVRGRAAGL